MKDLVKSSVEETLNALLEHEADELINAERYERTGDRRGYRSGHYDRNFTTTSGDVTLHVPKLKGIQFETAIIERYRRRETSIEETLTFMDFPSQHWTRIRTNNTLERLNREIKRRTKPIGAFPDGNSALMLVCARLRHVAGSDWGIKRYMNMDHLLEMDTVQEELLIG